jgi:hypothetical protein
MNNSNYVLNRANHSSRRGVTARSVLIHEDHRFEEIQHDSEGVDRQSCPWMVRRHHQMASYRMLDMGEKREQKEAQCK